MIGEFAWRVRGRPWRMRRNLITTEGRDWYINEALLDTAPPALYCAPFGSNATPDVSWTGATFTATAGELTSSVEGYEEATRQLWTPYSFTEEQYLADDASLPPVGPSVQVNRDVASHTAVPMSFRIKSASTLTVYGFGMLTTSAKGNTAGVLFSAMRFDAPEVYATGDVLDVYYILKTSNLTPA